jgi:hypothetical protein
MVKWAVVIPTIRQEKFLDFLANWEQLFVKHSVRLIVVQDNNERWELPSVPYKIEQYVHDDIDNELGHAAFCIPRNTDCIRSFGFYKAYLTDVDYVLTLDDDVRPIDGLDVFSEYEKVFVGGMYLSEYVNTGMFFVHPEGMFMRGFPFSDRHKKKVALQYGMWAGVPDLDGITQLSKPVDNGRVGVTTFSVPKYAALTGCIMNCAFQREFAICFYQLLMGKNYPFDRWGDIWSGLVAKRVCDQNDWAVVINSYATVEHLRASDVNTNIKKESSGYAINEYLWDEISMSTGSYEQIMNSLCDNDVFRNKEYSEKLKEAVNAWLGLFKR